LPTDVVEHALEVVDRHFLEEERHQLFTDRPHAPRMY